MAEYLMAADAGRAPEPAAFLARYPDLRAELTEFLADQAGLERLVEPLRAGPAASTGAASAVTLTADDAGRPASILAGDATAPGTIGRDLGDRNRRREERLQRDDQARPVARCPPSATSATTRSEKSWAAAAWASSTRPARSASTGPSPSR